MMKLKEWIMISGISLPAMDREGMEPSSNFKIGIMVIKLINDINYTEINIIK